MSKATSAIEALSGGARYKLCGRDSVAYNTLFTTSLTSASPGVLDGFGFPACCRSLTYHLRVTRYIDGRREISSSHILRLRTLSKARVIPPACEPGLTEDICA